MFRFVANLAVLLGAFSTVWASPSPRQAANRPISGSITRNRPAWSDEFQMLPTTEVLLDGEPCRYSDVPSGARIITLEVAADRRTILRIHFVSVK